MPRRDRPVRRSRRPDYLHGNEPITIGTSDILEAAASGFILTYAENLTASASALKASEGGALIIDLGGRTTLTFKDYCAVSKSASLTVRNGSFIHAGQLDLGRDSIIRWENLDISVTSSNGQFLRNTGAILDEYVSCNISIHSGTKFSLMNNSATSGKSRVVFTDTTISSEGDRTIELFSIIQYSNVFFEIRFNSGSKVLGNVPSYVLLNERSSTNDFSKKAQIGRAHV